MKKVCGAMICFLIPAFACSQNGKKPKAKQDSLIDVYLSNEGLNRLVNSKFSQLVTGNGAGTEVSNYASFEPLNGSFVFKGSIPLSKKAEKARFSYLSVRLEGDVISGSYASLFTGKALNTNSVIDAQLHWKPTKTLKKVRYLGIEGEIMAARKKVIENALSKQLDLDFDDWKKELSSRIVSLAARSYTLDQKVQAIARLQNERSNKIALERVKQNPDYTVIKKLTDESIADSKEEEEARALRKALSIQLDSLTVVYKHPDQTYYIQAGNEAIAQRDAKIEMLEKEAGLTAYQFGWLTITAGTSKKKYYTFDGNLSFPEQIDEKKLNVFRWGLSWNIYRERSFPRRILYANIGFLQYRDNNTKLLTTQDVVQVKTIKNVAGDTVRTVSKTYKAYTDPIVEQTLWNAYTNVYFIHSSRTSAFHLFPNVDFYEDGKIVSNIGVGYAVSFKNEKKDQPVINVEGYVKFKDLFNRVDSELTFWNRSEIGVSFTLPFNFFIK